MADTIPVTVLTGFLGSGKTTLLNRVLRDPALAGTAVLINEFGDIGLDHLLVETLRAEPDGGMQTVLLASGCLCCTVRGDLARALHDLMPRIADGTVRRVMIETTGLADPAPILHTMMRDPLITIRYRMDGVVTLVDAVLGDAQFGAQPEAVRQAAMADVILLSKIDLAAAEVVSALRERLSRLNPAARILDAATAPAARLIGLGLFDETGKIPDVRAWLAAEAHGDAHDHGHDHDHDHDRSPHAHPDPSRHDARIRSFCLTFDRPLHWQGIGACLEMLIATRGESLLRVKGILNLAGQDRPVVIHGVQHLFSEPALLAAWPADDDRTSRVVFITRDLDRRTIEDSLHAFEAAAAD